MKLSFALVIVVFVSVLGLHAQETDTKEPPLVVMAAQLAESQKQLAALKQQVQALEKLTAPTAKARTQQAKADAKAARAAQDAFCKKIGRKFQTINASPDGKTAVVVCR